VGRRCSVDDVGIGALEVRDELEHRLVLGVEVQQDGHVAELERAVDEDHLLVELGCGGDGQVDGDGGPADAALGAEDRHDGAEVVGLRSAARRRGYHSRPAFSFSRE
jgi:hypothetical protein